jgi:hypothetical protein
MRVRFTLDNGGHHDVDLPLDSGIDQKLARWQVVGDLVARLHEQRFAAFKGVNDGPPVIVATAKVVQVEILPDEPATSFTFPHVSEAVRDA